LRPLPARAAAHESSTRFSFQFGKNLHVPVEARRAARQVLADERVLFAGMFGHADQVGIWWAANPLRIRKGFGEVGFGEAKEFAFVDIVSLISRHYYALPGFNSSVAASRVVHGNDLLPFVSRTCALRSACPNLTSAAWLESP